MQVVVSHVLQADGARVPRPGPGRKALLFGHTLVLLHFFLNPRSQGKGKHLSVTLPNTLHSHVFIQYALHHVAIVSQLSQGYAMRWWLIQLGRQGLHQAAHLLAFGHPHPVRYRITSTQWYIGHINLSLHGMR